MAATRRNLRLVGTAAALLLVAAQCLPGGAAEPDRVVRYTVYAPDPLPPLAVASGPAGEWRPLLFRPTRRSTPYVHRGNGPLVILRANGTPAAEFLFPPGLSEALLVVREIRGAVHVLALDDPAAAPGLLVVNLSGLALTGRIAGREIRLEAGERTRFSASMGEIELRTEFRGKKYPAISLPIPEPAAGTACLLLLPPFNPGSLEVQWRTLVYE